jgi:hypothetical protein
VYPRTDKSVVSDNAVEAFARQESHAAGRACFRHLDIDSLKQKKSPRMSGGI